MSKKYILILIGLVLTIYSCKPDEIAEPKEPVEVIDSTTFKPQINITYEVLDSGWVQFYNNSTFYNLASFSTIWGVTSSRRVKNPKIWFPNGTQAIVFGAETKYGVGVDTTFTLNITNSVSQVDSKRFVKGVVFGDSIDVYYESYFQNTFLGGGIPSYDTLTPMAFMNPKVKFRQFSIADLNTVRGNTIEKMRALFKVGQVPLAKFNVGDGGSKPLEPGWQIFFFGEFESGNRSTISGWDNKNESIKILEVKEIYQAPVFPGLESTAFIVTFRYQATTYGNNIGTGSDLPHIPGKDKIDLTFEVKYCFFPNWQWY